MSSRVAVGWAGAVDIVSFFVFVSYFSSAFVRRPSRYRRVFGKRTQTDNDVSHSVIEYAFMHYIAANVNTNVRRDEANLSRDFFLSYRRHRNPPSLIGRRSNNGSAALPLRFFLSLYNTKHHSARLHNEHK